MAEIKTLVIPAKAEHTLVFSEAERLALLASLRYKYKDVGGDMAGKLIATLGSVNNG